jgi:hypothetical protein
MKTTSPSPLFNMRIWKREIIFSSLRRWRFVPAREKERIESLLELKKSN